MSGPATEDAPDQSAEPEPRQKSPEATAIIFSRAVFAWLSPLFRLGNKQSLNDSDLYDLVDRDKARTITQSFDDAWEASGLAAAEKAKAAGNQGDGDAPKSQGASSVSTVDVRCFTPLHRAPVRPDGAAARAPRAGPETRLHASGGHRRALQALELHSAVRRTGDVEPAAPVAGGPGAARGPAVLWPGARLHLHCPPGAHAVEQGHHREPGALRCMPRCRQLWASC